MKTITLEELLEAGCHFGHQVTRQNPKARDFVFEARDGIHIIDLEKTKTGLETASSYLKDLASKGGSIIFVGAKRQARTIVEEEVQRARAAVKETKGSKETEETNGVSVGQPQDDGGIFYVTNRWIGGVLTNFPEITKNVKKLNDLKKRLESEEAKQGYTKKEIGKWEKEKAKLTSLYSGIADMKKIPDALFIVDTHLEDLVVREAQKTNVKTVGITDTNSDPYIIDYPIPANDDAVGSLKLIITYLVDSWIEGKVQSEKLKAANLPAGRQGEKEEKSSSKEEEVDKGEKVTVKKAAPKKVGKGEMGEKVDEGEKVVEEKIQVAKEKPVTKSKKKKNT